MKLFFFLLLLVAFHLGYKLGKSTQETPDNSLSLQTLKEQQALVDVQKSTIKSQASSIELGGKIIAELKKQTELHNQYREFLCRTLNQLMLHTGLTEFTVHNTSPEGVEMFLLYPEPEGDVTSAASVRIIHHVSGPPKYLIFPIPEK